MRCMAGNGWLAGRQAIAQSIGLTNDEADAQVRGEGDNRHTVCRLVTKTNGNSRVRRRRFA